MLFNRDYFIQNLWLPFPIACQNNLVSNWSHYLNHCSVYLRHHGSSARSPAISSWKDSTFLQHYHPYPWTFWHFWTCFLNSEVMKSLRLQRSAISDHNQFSNTYSQQFQEVACPYSHGKNLNFKVTLKLHILLLVGIVVWCFHAYIYLMIIT